MNKKNFLKAINTLKLYRRAELLNDDGKRLIDELYIDPLPSDHVLHTLLRPNSTFLIGRKGTGKSTIFQRAQGSLDKDKNSTWAYIDIKTLYESSSAEILLASSNGLNDALTRESIQKLYIFKNFIIELILEIKKQIKQRIHSTTWSRLRDSFTGSSVELFERLDELIQDIKQDEFLNVTASYTENRQQEDLEKKQTKIAGYNGFGGGYGLDVAKTLKIIAYSYSKQGFLSILTY